MTIVSRLDLSLKTPKEKLVALFSQTARIDTSTDRIVQEQLTLSSAEWDEETLNAVMRLLGLPLTKKLIYFRRTNDGWKQYPVEYWNIVQEYDTWCTLQIYVKEIGKINIHHAFLSEMQKPSFIRDMEHQAAMESEI